MKLYLAGPMTGLPDLNFPAFRTAADALSREGHEVFNPANLGISDYRKALTACLLALCTDAEAIALLPGWENSKGARAELHTAIALDLKVIHLSVKFHRVIETPTENANELSRSHHGT